MAELSSFPATTLGWLWSLIILLWRGVHACVHSFSSVFLFKCLLRYIRHADCMFPCSGMQSLLYIFFAYIISYCGYQSSRPEGHLHPLLLPYDFKKNLYYWSMVVLFRIANAGLCSVFSFEECVIFVYLHVSPKITAQDTQFPYFRSLHHARTHATVFPVPGLARKAGKPPRDMSAGINSVNLALLTQPWFMRENVSSRPTV